MDLIGLESNDYSDRYAAACDALCRALWAEQYGIDEDDPTRHTSDEARRVALAVFDAIGLVERDPTVKG